MPEQEYSQQRQMALMLFMAPAGYQTAAWRHPESRTEDLYGFELPKYMAQRAEAAKLHAVFLADWLSFGNTGRNPDLTAYEPFTVMGALSAVTKHIGIVGTASTTFVEPYHLARYFSQIDWLSGGRAGWNIVTSTTGEENFMTELPSRDGRYERAEEYLRVVTRLWDAWRDDAVVNDREAGVWADTDRIRPINYASDHYRVEGPLLVPRSPQGWPLLVQAGSSDSGKEFAAKLAEVVFTVHATYDSGNTFYNDLKQRTVAAGRRESDIHILPGLMPIVGGTEAEAKRIYDELMDLVQVDRGRERITELLRGAELDIDDLDLDDTIPAERLVEPDRAVAEFEATTRYPHFYHLAVNEKYTLRQLIREAFKSGGHGVIAGTPEQVADHMEHWFTNRASDGFAILPPTVPVGMERFFDDVIPILQERGLFRTDYVEGTLRDNLGLDRPASTMWAADGSPIE